MPEHKAICHILVGSEVRGISVLGRKTTNRYLQLELLQIYWNTKNEVFYVAEIWVNKIVMNCNSFLIKIYNPDHKYSLAVSIQCCIKISWNLLKICPGNPENLLKIC